MRLLAAVRSMCRRVYWGAASLCYAPPCRIDLVNQTAANSSGFGGHALGLPGVQLPEAQQRAMRRAYYAAVSHTDEQIGRVLAALAATGLREHTVVCFFADHGL